MDNLSDPVIWFNRRYNHSKFPSSSPYDLFEFIAPLEYDGTPDVKNNDYEVRFHGAYRYRNPDDDLVKFESGTAIIKNGLITSLKTWRRENEYASNWVNIIYRFYWFFGLLLSTLLALVILNIQKLPNAWGQLLADGVRKLLRIG